MLGMGSGNVNEDNSDTEGSAQGQRPAPSKPKGFAGFLFTLQHFLKNFSRINWSATGKALFAAIGAKKNNKKIKATADTSKVVNSDSPNEIVETSPEIKPGIRVSRASEDADIEEWLNKITQKAARDTSPKKPTVKPSASRLAKSSAKTKVTVKKAAPKGKNPRSAKNS
jgi:hypothetical protein